MSRVLPFALLVALLCAPGVARAGTYDVYGCWAGSDSFRNPGANGSAWAKTAPSPDRFGAFDQCGSSTNGLGVIALSGYDASPGTYGEVSFAAAPGTVITHLRLWRGAWTYGSGSGGDSHRNYLGVLADGRGQPQGDNFDGSSDVPHGGAGTDDTSSHGLIPANQMDADFASSTPSSVQYRVGCSFSSCPTGGPDGGFASGVKVYGSVVTLRDNTQPDLSVVAGSGLLTAGQHHGSETVHVTSAADNTGIKRLAVFADEATSPVGVVDFERAADRCQWWLPRPCQDVKDVDIPVDTRRVADGDHHFVVRAYDAAENVRAWTSDVVTVKNGADAKPDSFGAPVPVPLVRGPLNGAGATDAARLAVRWKGGHTTTRRSRFSRASSIRGLLLDDAGRAIVGAVVSVGVVGVGGAETAVGTARTDSAGAFRYVVGARGPSRQLVVSYRSHLGDPAPVASAQLGLRVSAAVRLRVKPGHVVNGDSIRFTGSLLGGPVPARGKLIDMQVRVGRDWKTFATVRGRGPRGEFNYKYRFGRTYGRISYRFRALSRVEEAYPYATGASRVVKVTVN